MKVPISWLRELVDFDLTPGQLAERLTFSGMEIEGIHAVGHRFDGLVVAEIRAIEKHPKADRLQVCRVFDGRSERQVVCGATNYVVGDKAALAPSGSVLPGGMVIQRAKIRGVESDGMLCAEDELGLSEDHTGILLVPASYAAGTPLVEVTGQPDTVLDVEITWNRADCLSLIGMAREVAALVRGVVRLPANDFAESDEAVERHVRVGVSAPGDCSRYTARVLSGVRLGPSPAWMQKRLQLCGVRPINNIVDVTNYVMLECGQPLHAFDHGLLRDSRIEVRRARAGEKLVTLDGVDRAITPEMLVIADGERPVALAGVMGGAGSEIGPEVTRVLLESACFDPAITHRTSVALGLNTESSRRFERGVDSHLADWASRRAARLMVELCGGTVARGVVDLWPGRRERKKVRCRGARVRSLLGVEVGDGEIVDILSRLGFESAPAADGALEVLAPTYRLDIELEADLIEEVARMHGLEGVPAREPVSRLCGEADHARARSMIAFRRTLTGLGLTEVMHYSFASESLFGLCPVGDGVERVVLPNPVSADHSVMRSSLLPQMVETLGRNLARQVEDVAFFETGRIFRRKADGGVREEERLSVGLMGRAGRSDRSRRPVTDEEMFLWIKGLVESIVTAQHVGVLTLKPVSAAPFEESACCEVHVGGVCVGLLGLLSEKVRAEWRIQGPAGLAELRLAELLERKEHLPKLAALPVYPSVSRDVAMVVPEGVRHEQVMQVIQQCGVKELTGVELFDIFRSKGIGAGCKSLAYCLVYRSFERTLTDEEANGFHETIKNALRRELSAEIREN